ncbi:MAG: hypothetical protein EZS28_019980 [Streblomastix strix]|uniref:Uncharacterized protein n=1 Tax=Streblomastix strix TaxID=222440 RepID=A0A5J4VPH8_9EUKA|nr:MAG: hypothetical protein EZS28_019980 [Streblomastix strix]
MVQNWCQRLLYLFLHVFLPEIIFQMLLLFRSKTNLQHTMFAISRIAGTVGMVRTVSTDASATRATGFKTVGMQTSLDHVKNARDA